MQIIKDDIERLVCDNVGLENSSRCTFFRV